MEILPASSSFRIADSESKYCPPDNLARSSIVWQTVLSSSEKQTPRQMPGQRESQEINTVDVQRPRLEMSQSN